MVVVDDSGSAEDVTTPLVPDESPAGGWGDWTETDMVTVQYDKNDDNVTDDIFSNGNLLVTDHGKTLKHISELETC